jgi:hypothetical protein
MRTTSAERVGLAIVRVWLEEDPACSVRARVTTIDDVAGPAAGVVEWTGCDGDATLERLRAWLEEWVKPPG